MNLAVEPDRVHWVYYVYVEYIVTKLGVSIGQLTVNCVILKNTIWIWLTDTHEQPATGLDYLQAPKLRWCSDMMLKLTFRRPGYTLLTRTCAVKVIWLWLHGIQILVFKYFTAAVGTYTFGFMRTSSTCISSIEYKERLKMYSSTTEFC